MIEFDLDEVAIIYSPDFEDFAERVRKALAEECKRDGIEFGKIHVRYFNNGEIYPRILMNVRERHAYVLHTFTGEDHKYNPNSGFMCLYLIDDALLRSSVREITYVLPHVPYQRQDRRKESRTPISAQRAIRMLLDPGKVIKRLVTFDMHAGQIEGFVNYDPVDPLNAAPLFVDYFKNHQEADNFTIVSPDAGGADRARYMARKLNNNEIALIDKRRPEAGVAEVMYVVGRENVSGRPCIILDDMIDTAGTAIKAAEAIRKEGAADVYLCATHPVMSLDKRTPDIPTEEKLRKSGMKVITTDTIPRSREYLEENKDWLTVLSVADRAAEAIHIIQTRGSISELIS